MRRLSPGWRASGLGHGLAGFTALPFASRRVPCDARATGRAAELAARASRAPLKQPPQVRARSALRAPAGCPALLGSAQAPASPCPKPEASEVPAHQRLSANLASAPATPTYPRLSASPVSVRPGPTAAQAPMRRREAQDGRPRAQRASCSDLRQLFERSWRRQRSEFCRGPSVRASQGTLREAKGAAFEAGAAVGPGLTRQARRQ